MKELMEEEIEERGESGKWWKRRMAHMWVIKMRVTKLII